MKKTPALPTSAPLGKTPAANTGEGNTREEKWRKEKVRVGKTPYLRRDIVLLADKIVGWTR